MRFVIGGLVALLGLSASASGWNDYSLEIATGFEVSRMNTFDVCLGLSNDTLIICPDDPPAFGPLSAYAVTSEAIYTRHFGAMRSALNPSMWDADPRREFFFRVRRADAYVEGPYTSAEWQRARLPDVASLNWRKPRNPYWTTIAHLLWPLAVLAFVYGGFEMWRVFRRPSRRSRAAV